MTVDQLLNAVQVVLGLSLLACVIRLIIGPTRPDRVVALDMMAVTAIAMFGVAAVQSGRGWFLDAAIVLALLAFVSTVAFARLIAKGKSQE